MPLRTPAHGHHQLTPALQQLSATNRGPLLIVATYIFLCTSLLAVCTKIWTRLAATRRLAWTDWVIIIAWACSVAQAAALTIAVNNGVGRHISGLTSAEIETASKVLYASNMFIPIVLGSAKASATLLILYMQPFRPARTACQLFLGLLAAWVVASVVSFAFQCDMNHAWAILAPNATGATCVDQFAMYVGLGVVDIVTDLVIVALAFAMVRTVQIPVRKKLIILGLFGLRIANLPFTVLVMVSLRDYYAGPLPLDRTRRAVMPLIWQQVLMGTSIITACIPSCKRFFHIVQSGVTNIPVSTVQQYERYEQHQSHQGSAGLMERISRPRLASGAEWRSTTTTTEGADGASRGYSVHIEGGSRDGEKLLGHGQGIRQQTECAVVCE